MIYIIDHKDSFTHNIVHQFSNFDKVFCDDFTAINKKKLDKAKILYKKCNTIIPNQIEILHNLANVYFKLKEYKEALPILQKIINPNFKYEVNCEKIAQCLFVIQTKKETKKFIDSVLPKFPNNKLLNILLGKSLLHLNLHSRGLEYIQKNEGIIEFSESGVKYFQ